MINPVCFHSGVKKNLCSAKKCKKSDYFEVPAKFPIKEVPANVCKQCGERYFDDDVMENLEKIIEDVKNVSIEISVVNYKGKTA